MPPEGPPGTDAFRERIWRSLQAAQKEGSGQGAARFLIVSILKSRIPRTLISPRDPVSYLRRAAWSAILRPGRPPEPAASHKRQDPGEGGDALRRPWCHSAVQIKEIREDPGIPSSDLLPKLPELRPAGGAMLHFAFRSSVSRYPPDVLSALALLHPAQDLGARSRIPFLLLRQVRDVQQIPGFRRRRTPFPAGKVSLIEGSHRLLHLRYFLRRPKGQRLPRSCHLRSCNSQQKALSRTAFAMERSGRYSGISIAWVA